MLLTGLVGRSILASRSPWLHEQEAQAQEIALRYTLFDFTDRGMADADLGPLLVRLAGEGYAGVNVTFPFKQAVLPLLDELAESARDVGAVNTIEMRDGRLIGHNTDMIGFREALVAGLPDCPRDTVLQLGAGGAGAAVAVALLSTGVDRLILSDTDRDRAEALAVHVAAKFPGRQVDVRPAADLDLAAVDGIVNATPIGMASNPGVPIALDHLSRRHWVADIVYFPIETALLAGARAIGCATLDGSGMVVRQAAAAFQIFTGRPASSSRMLQRGI